MANKFTEDALVEQSAITLFQSLDWEHFNAQDELPVPTSPLGRETRADIVLLPRLRAAMQKLNPDATADIIDQAIAQLTKDRGTLSLTRANQEIYNLIRDGIKVETQTDDGRREPVTLKVIDWQNPDNNDFLLVSQLWVTGPHHTRRPDLVGFVNGLPLILMENKAPTKPVKDALDNNIRDYKDTIPQLFWYNAFILITNGTDSRIGTLSATWEHFSTWKRITSEDEPANPSLETLINGVAEKNRLLDIVENFTLFDETQGSLAKIVAKNHQYIGVNLAVERFRNKPADQPGAGVFWHTQGSGKSYSMIFYSRKIFRRLKGNWTFVVLTDREELDDQIYKNFAHTGAVKEPEEQVHAQSAAHLKELLRGDHRYVFTLIHKFRDQEKLSERDDIIVMADEAHRTQYDILAMNMRLALPNASFIAFTGTPLIKGSGEEKTRQTFGDYVSVYNFRQSVEDNATVPLFYENRIPELQLNENDLKDQLQEVLEESELDEAQEAKLEKYFSKQYHLITRDDRLDRIAADIVDHFIGRGYAGKAMVVSIDKVTAYRMHDKVRQAWEDKLKQLRRDLHYTKATQQENLQKTIRYMEETDMAVVVSNGQNEVADTRKFGLDIGPLKERMEKEDLAEKFKSVDDPLRIVFVCAMWMTGFDAKPCSTVYLDRPMKNHTLMQTIARANRVFKNKPSGIIVDYIGVFRNLQKAFALYAADPEKDGESPIERKQAIAAQLEESLAELRGFAALYEVSEDQLQSAEQLDLLNLINAAAESLMRSEEVKKDFLQKTQTVYRLYKAMLPDAAAAHYYDRVKLYLTIAENIQSRKPETDITDIIRRVEELLDATIATADYDITSQPPTDLSKIDFDKLARQFEKGQKRHAIDLMQQSLQQRVNHLYEMNRTRVDLVEKFRLMVDAYNSGSHALEEMLERFKEFGATLDEEERRALREGLDNEEELAIYDLLTKPGPKLTKQHEAEVKRVVRDMLPKLKELLSLNWRAKEFARAAVEVAIKDDLDRLPDTYDKVLYDRKCLLLRDHLFNAYQDSQQSVYTNTNPLSGASLSSDS